VSPNHQLVAELGATGRHLAALGLLAMVVILAIIAWYLGRNQSNREVQHGKSQSRTNPIQTRTGSVGRPSDMVSEGAQTHNQERDL
jgi:hypothetical protein